MNCQDVQEQLSDYLDFSLTAARLALVEKHLSACPPCREEAELLGESIRQVAALPALDMPLGFTQRVMSHVREEEAQPSFWQRFLPPLNGKRPAQATAVVIVAFLGLYLLQRDPPPQQATPAPVAVKPAGSTGEESAPLIKEPSPPKTSATPRPQSSSTRRTSQIAASPQQPQSNLREEISSHVEAPAAQLPTVETLPNPSLSQQTAADVIVRPTPVVSGTTAPAAPAPPSSGGTSLSNRSDPDISTSRASPVNIEPFADLELILRRHTTLPVTDSGAVVRKTEAGQGAAPRPIERLMAAIPDRTRPQTIWINVPEHQYEYFKSELYTIGIIESESRVPMLREQTAGYADGQIRVKLTALPAAETATSNNPPTGR